MDDWNDIIEVVLGIHVPPVAKYMLHQYWNQDWAWCGRTLGARQIQEVSEVCGGNSVFTWVQFCEILDLIFLWPPGWTGISQDFSSEPQCRSAYNSYLKLKCCLDQLFQPGVKWHCRMYLTSVDIVSWGVKNWIQCSWNHPRNISSTFERTWLVASTLWIFFFFFGCPVWHGCCQGNADVWRLQQVPGECV